MTYKSFLLISLLFIGGGCQFTYATEEKNPLSEFSKAMEEEPPQRIVSNETLQEGRKRKASNDLSGHKIKTQKVEEKNILFLPLEILGGIMKYFLSMFA